MAWRESHDLLLTDPPYGINVATMGGLKARSVRPYVNGRHSANHTVRGAYDWKPIEGDNRPFDPTRLLGFRHAVMWGANNYADRLPVSPCWFAWDRKAGRAADSDITDCELAWVRGLPFKTVRLFRHMWAGFQRDSEVGERHLHPAQKPIALMAWCLSFFENETVVDPYMGSGTVGIAAVRACRRYIGIECDPAYFDIACRRIEQAQRQGDLLNRLPPAEDPADRRMADLFTEPETGE